MARLDRPLMLGYNDYFRQSDPWCCAGVGIKHYEIPYDFEYQIDREQIVNHIQDLADKACVKSYQFCSIDGNITYDVCGEQSVRIHFICKVSKSEVLKFKDYIYRYIGELTEYFYSRFYRLDFNLEVIETSPIQESAIIFKEENIMKKLPEVKKIIHSGDYTHIIWEDDTKTSVKRASGTPDDPYSAFAQAVIKKLYGSTEKAKFEHELKQKSDKEQKKILAEKAKRREKQEKAESKKRVKAKKLNKEIDDTEKYLEDLKRKAKDFLGD